MQQVAVKLSTQRGKGGTEAHGFRVQRVFWVMWPRVARPSWDFVRVTVRVFDSNRGAMSHNMSKA